MIHSVGIDLHQGRHRARCLDDRAQPCDSFSFLTTPEGLATLEERVFRDGANLTKHQFVTLPSAPPLIVPIENYIHSLSLAIRRSRIGSKQLNPWDYFTGLFGRLCTSEYWMGVGWLEG